ncbi:MAG: hypothetical protein COU11_04580 [Candidatus Harrisonbacteria bacterium CG10_big_fil_rev_8_21_14_0_10_49_15]|uniref:Uncharacterized protein n=1 Tax=Candidatus Harrisonbacteria bacterium CG10_big_fil_rev_8_21_14_0_10_49_15 TaxID=1974587 RepID=A0A2H0ULU9_9BACT|nr:MAG: hypothetical protein COU11_04580 [Candidatus Harrisonbacteria bacterium CG10_big_fil_rev_8_21_14_0_10_49_15]
MAKKQQHPKFVRLASVDYGARLRATRTHDVRKLKGTQPDGGRGKEADRDPSHSGWGREKGVCKGAL